MQAAPELPQEFKREDRSTKVSVFIAWSRMGGRRVEHSLHGVERIVEEFSVHYMEQKEWEVDSTVIIWEELKGAFWLHTCRSTKGDDYYISSEYGYYEFH